MANKIYFEDVDTFAEYQKAAGETSLNTAVHDDTGLVYDTLGLVNEAGEVAGKVKKLYRDRKGLISEDFLEDIKSEIGDVLWYLADLSAKLDEIYEEIDADLGTIATNNLNKLYDRKARGKITGSGDIR